MPSSFGWVDLEEKSRRRMLDVIELFREQDTLDELGFGPLRAAFADFFFPGTSTIQTRARYFLFIPWIYKHLEAKETPSTVVSLKARETEIKLIYELLGGEKIEKEGIIGRIARGKLQRLPSNIYWVGLHTLGIRVFPWTQDQYHRYLDVYYTRMNQRMLTDDKEPVEGHLDYNWD